MYDITLIFTMHEECGKCNFGELYKIIESINPEIIFEELSSNLFDKFYNRNQLSDEPMEVKAVKKYIQNHNIKHTPVDIDADQGLSNYNIEYMFNIFRKYDAYKKLEDEQYSMIERDGFVYLNSKKCAKLFDKMKIAEKNIMEFDVNRNLLSRIYELFHEEQNNRENAMLNNIYNYSKDNQCNQGILLIGSGHRKSIMEKIEECKAKETIKLNWKLL